MSIWRIYFDPDKTAFLCLVCFVLHAKSYKLSWLLHPLPEWFEFCFQNLWCFLFICFCLLIKEADPGTLRRFDFVRDPVLEAVYMCMFISSFLSCSEISGWSSVASRHHQSTKAIWCFLGDNSQRFMRSFFESSFPVRVIFMRFMWRQQLVGDEASSARRGGFWGRVAET